MFITTRIRKIRQVGLIAVVLSVQFGAEVCRGQNRSPNVAVDNFLKGLLVDKNMTSVVKMFADKAFVRNRLMSPESCSGYVVENDRKYPAIVNRQVLKFLTDLAHASHGRSLKEKLKYDWENQGIASDLKGKALSSIAKDGYLLVDIKYVLESKNQKYLTENFPADEHLLSLILLKTREKKELADFLLHVIWTNEYGTWKIIGLGMDCM